MDTQKTSDDFYDELSNLLGKENLYTDKSDCWSYGYDNSRRHFLPSAVAFPTDHDRVAQIVQHCYQHRVPLVARGGGTGATGGSVPIHQGVVLSFERMRNIIEYDPFNRVMIVEPGITNQAVQDAAAEQGFFWAPNPSSGATCTIGGNLSFNAAGPRAIKYGTCRENTLGLKAVTGTGETISTGVYTSKGVVGYDLTRLLIGSEGTLAIVTEATLKLLPLAESKVTMSAAYQTVEEAAQAVSSIMSQGSLPCALEFMDKSCIDMIRDFSQVDLPTDAEALLIIEADNAKAALSSVLKAIHQAANNDGLISWIEAETQADIQALWETRKALSPALRNIAPNKINEDIVVPVSQIPTLIEELKVLSRNHDLQIVTFGHAGDGNLHVNLLLDSEDEQQRQRAHDCLSDVFDLVLSLRGTLSGEHGVAMDKQAFIDREIDPVSLRLMREIKGVFDPGNILNPGKMFPLDQ